eukprot:CAMPEP_0185848284 /NCGR_PEP_ID=MMETSP1354-20130828/3234_1 /TAXON_ID=708628 /ORGANISM="Erythrolobus madagascarensis, Strain CCMP3276" /LENGTH=66 /DNA_ID=CAMNT_0028548671 /DNA_START=215 /DNA_END=415 /DNA_ORIENTATION=-
MGGNDGDAEGDARLADAAAFLPVRTVVIGTWRARGRLHGADFRLMLEPLGGGGHPKGDGRDAYVDR